MHTQSDTAKAILARQADYVMTVKANMPTLYRQLRQLPWSAVPSFSSVSTGHGRRARRTIKAVRGAKGKDGKSPHLVAALAHGIGAVLGQVAVNAKSNEIPAVRDLLAAFADLAGAVITLDALCRRRHNASYGDPVVMPIPPSGGVSVVAAGRTAGGIITGTRGTPRGRPGAGSVRS